MLGASAAKYLNSCLVFLLAKDLVAQIRMLAGGSYSVALIGLRQPFLPLMDLRLDSELEGGPGPVLELPFGPEFLYPLSALPGTRRAGV